MALTISILYLVNWQMSLEAINIYLHFFRVNRVYFTSNYYLVNNWQLSNTIEILKGRLIFFII